ncbi:MAG: twin-arginine translocase TatA/TatE family subunit [Myxococcota bacterium]
MFGGLGFWEISIILGIALIILGPTKLPELARSFGKGLREFRKATEEFKSTIDTEVHRPDPPKPSARIESPKPAATVPSAPAAEVDSVSETAAQDDGPKVEAEPMAVSRDEDPSPDAGPDKATA